MLGVYRITAELADPQLAAKQSEAERHIIAVCEGLRQFSQDTVRANSSQEDAGSSILALVLRIQYAHAYVLIYEGRLSHHLKKLHSKPRDHIGQ